MIDGQGLGLSTCRKSLATFIT